MRRAGSPGPGSMGFHSKPDESQVGPAARDARRRSSRSRSTWTSHSPRGRAGRRSRRGREGRRRAPAPSEEARARAAGTRRAPARGPRRRGRPGRSAARRERGLRGDLPPTSPDSPRVMSAVVEDDPALGAAPGHPPEAPAGDRADRDGPDPGPGERQVARPDLRRERGCRFPRPGSRRWPSAGTCPTRARRAAGRARPSGRSAGRISLPSARTGCPPRPACSSRSRWPPPGRPRCTASGPRRASTSRSKRPISSADCPARARPPARRSAPSEVLAAGTGRAGPSAGSPRPGRRRRGGKGGRGRTTTDAAPKERRRPGARRPGIGHRPEPGARRKGSMPASPTSTDSEAAAERGLGPGFQEAPPASPLPHA